MTDLTPTIERVKLRRVPEVRTNRRLEAILKRVYGYGLPGFLIRASGLTDTGAQTHEEITQAVIDAFPGEAGGLLVFRKSSLDFHMSKGTSELHHDLFDDEDLHRVRVHRTIEGEGKVFLANSGSLIADHYLLGTTPTSNQLTRDHLDMVNPLFAAGLVDSQVINPIIYTADLLQDDTVVFPLGLERSLTHDKAGPVWHRFDTSTDRRIAAISVIERIH